MAVIRVGVIAGIIRHIGAHMQSFVAVRLIALHYGARNGIRKFENI